MATCRLVIDMNHILEKLGGGDLRSIGRANEVVEDILSNPALFCEVFEGITNNDPRVRMRSCDALEKVCSKHPEYLQPFKERLINEISQMKQQEVQWHVAQMFSYLELSSKERDKIITILLSYIDTSNSNIVTVCSLQTLTNLALKDGEIRSLVCKTIQKAMRNASPAVVSRGKKLINQLKEH